MDKLDCTCVIFGICPPQRINWLCQNIEHLDKQNFPFKQKILMIDEFNGHTFDSELKKKFESTGWHVEVCQYKSRVKTFLRFFELNKSEIVYYNEDDVLSTMPNPDDVLRVFNTTVDNRQCGMLSLTLGGANIDPTKFYFADILEYKNKSILKNDTYTVFVRNEQFRNLYFFEFPGLFVKADILHECLKHGTPGAQIEMGLTEAYFRLQYNVKYFKAALCLNGTEEYLKENAFCVNDKCRLLHNLDIHQGSSPFGGKHEF